MLIFLKSTDNPDSEYFAIDESQIETLNVSDSYTQYGQRVGANDAWDCLVILTQAAADKANEIESNYGDVEYDTDDPDYKAPEPSFSVGDIVYAYDDQVIFNELVESFEDGDAIEIERTMFPRRSQLSNYSRQYNRR